MMKKRSAKHITMLAMLITVALMLSYVETFIPAMPIPGAKIGLPNVVTLVALYAFGFWEALVITIIRTTISAFLFSSVISLMYSVTGGILSLLAMYFLKRITKEKASLQAVSITGAITHNLGQLIIAALVLETLSLATFLPWLIVLAVPAGIVVGILAKYLLRYFDPTFKIDEKK